MDQYLLALGEFSTDNFSIVTDEKTDVDEMMPNATLNWFFFILATFITQITIMNMLIAIMGDTFGKVTEIKEQSALREKIKILADFVDIVSLENKQSSYVYAMKPRNPSNLEEGSWEGTVTTLKKTIETSMRDQKSSFNKKIGDVQAEVKIAGTSVKLLEEKVNVLQGMGAKHEAAQMRQYDILKRIEERLAKNDDAEEDKGQSRNETRQGMFGQGMFGSIRGKADEDQDVEDH